LQVGKGAFDIEDGARIHQSSATTSATAGIADTTRRNLDDGVVPCVIGIVIVWSKRMCFVIARGRIEYTMQQFREAGEEHFASVAAADMHDKVRGNRRRLIDASAVVRARGVGTIYSARERWRQEGQNKAGDQTLGGNGDHCIFLAD